MTRRSSASLVTTVLLLAALFAWGPRPGNAQIGDTLKVEWDSHDTGTGQALVSGYVYNPHQMRVQRVQLLVASSSAPGRARTVYLTGTIPSQGREYFEVKMAAAEAPFTVTVAMFDWSGCGNG